MAVRTKLIGLFLLPFFGLVLIGGQSAYQNFSIRNEAMRLVTLSNLAVLSGNLLHETQKERGFTAGFLGSRGSRFGSELGAQRDEADSRIAALEGALASFESREEESQLAETLLATREKLDKLSEIRTRVSSQKISAPEAIGFYTSLNASMIAIVATLQENALDHLRSQSAAYSYFLMAKERAGIERAVLANSFAADSFLPGFYQKFVTLVAEQNAYFREFEVNAAPAGLKVFREAMLHPSINEVGAYRKVAHQQSASGGFKSDPKAWFASATARINQLKMVENSLSESLIRATKETASGSGTAALSYFGILLAMGTLAMGAGIPTLRSVLNPLDQLGVQLSEISVGDADLTKRLDLGRQDEIGRVGDAFDRFAERIRSVIAEVMTREGELEGSAQSLSQVVSRISSNAREMSGASEAVSEHAAELAERFGAISGSSRETSADVSTMSAAVDQVSSRLGSVTDRVNQISENFSSASTAIEELGTTIADVHARTSDADEIASRAADSARAANEGMSMLGNSANEIGKIVETINSIAEQTNLLALNATIEAASAGDAGRGFAVVANEVKELAKQTAEATDSIRTQVGGIQESTNASIRIIGDVATVIDELNEISSQIATIVSEQKATTANVAEMMVTSAEDSRLVASAVHECSVGAVEAAGSIERISVQASEVAQQMTTATDSADEILKNAKALGASISETRESSESVEGVSKDLREIAGDLGNQLRSFHV